MVMVDDTTLYTHPCWYLLVPHAVATTSMGEDGDGGGVGGGGGGGNFFPQTSEPGWPAHVRETESALLSERERERERNVGMKGGWLDDHVRETGAGKEGRGGYFLV